jgi:Ca2+-transporting ATPase
VLTIFFALGAWRLSRQQVLARHVPAVEMLGAATVLCSDKTGTLTLNRMTVAELHPDGADRALAVPSDGPVPEPGHELAAASILASRREPVDPTEQALLQLRPRLPAEPLRGDWSLVNEHPFSKRLPAVTYLWRAPDGRQVLAMCKGAPEAVATLCRLDGRRAERVAELTREMACKGLRVLGVAQARLDEDGQTHPPEALPFTWLGLVGLADPVRPQVPAAIAECREAGVRVVMITGDYPATARRIAEAIGMARGGAVLTGPELDALGDAALRERVRAVDLFARIVPEQKLRLVNALKHDGDIVAMTGDGVNDAPALKAAHIGIAMGGRGTDVAREAASLVLLDDDFSSIVRAVRAGRHIFDNLQKAMAYILAIHVPIAGIALIPAILRWPLVLLPVHIVFLELIIDPACSVAFEAEQEEPDIMRRPPRNPREPVFARRNIALSLLQGAGMLAAVWGVLALARWRGAGEAEARAMTFTSLVLGNLALMLTNRSWSRTILETLARPNPALWWIAGLAVCFLGIALYVPAVQTLFRFTPLGPADLLLCLSAAALGILWVELAKWFASRANSSVRRTPAASPRP